MGALVRSRGPVVAMAMAAMVMAVAMLLAPACARPPRPPAVLAGAERTAATDPLLIDPASDELGSDRRFLDRLVATPHGYYRFINDRFTAEVCRRFADRIAVSPTLHLHGDAHVEQYAVTDLGRGLTDFDDSTSGPALVDLLRYAVSLHLACRQAGCGAATGGLVDAFLDGYAKALEHPERRPPEPRYATRCRARFRDAPEVYLRKIENLMTPIDAAERARLEAALMPYCRDAKARRPDLRDGYFGVVSCGRLKTGVGSALDRKYLLRVQGASDAPRDDIVLEVKEVRARRSGSCVSAIDADPERVMAGEAILAYRPFKLLGQVEIDGRPYWVHAWVENYGELEIADAFRDPEEMVEVARDVGFQLGWGHPRAHSEAIAAQLRQGQLRLLELDRERIRAQAAELAALVVDAWERFRTALARRPGAAGD